MAPHFHISYLENAMDKELDGLQYIGPQELDTTEKLGSSSSRNSIWKWILGWFHGVGNATFHLAVSLESKAALSWASVPGNPPQGWIWSVPIIPGLSLLEWSHLKMSSLPSFHLWGSWDWSPNGFLYINRHISPEVRLGRPHPPNAPGPIGLCESSHGMWSTTWEAPPSHLQLRLTAVAGSF